MIPNGVSLLNISNVKKNQEIGKKDNGENYVVMDMDIPSINRDITIYEESKTPPLPEIKEILKRKRCLNNEQTERKKSRLKYSRSRPSCDCVEAPTN